MRQHTFDLAAENRSLVGEVRTYTLGEGGGRPSGKFAHCYAACLFLFRAKARRKLLVLTDRAFWSHFRRESEGLVEGIEIIHVPIEETAPIMVDARSSAFEELPWHMERWDPDVVSQHACDAEAFAMTHGHPVVHTLHANPLDPDAAVDRSGSAMVIGTDGNPVIGYRAAGGAIKASKTTVLMTGTEGEGALKKADAVAKAYKPAR